MSESEAAQQHKEIRTDINQRQVMDRAAVDMAQSSVRQRKENPEFADKLADPDADSDKHGWIEDEMGAAYSRQNILGNREGRYTHKREWLNLNRAERMVTRGDPGRLIRNDKRALAIAQEVHGRRDEHMRPAWTQQAREQIRDGHEIRTLQQSLAVGNTGLSSLTDATIVSKQEETTQESSSSLREKVSSLYGD